MTNLSGPVFWRSRSILVALAVAAAMVASPTDSRMTAAPSRAATLTDCTGQSDGTACDDGNACTVGETCQAGVCLRPASFAEPAGSPVASGATPRSVVIADVNGDGKLDLVVANYGDGNVSILLGSGSGGFSPASGSPVTVGALPISVAIGDMNGDGKLDLAVANYFSNDVTILLGNGLGGFSPAAGSPVTAGTSPRSIVIGDVNGDGKLDLAVANLSSNNVTILLGNGAGGFGPAAGSPVAVGTQPASIAVGDVNGDGRLDLAVANFGSNNVTILLGNGVGGFGPAAGSPVTVGTGPASVAMGQINGDSTLDLAVANYGSDNATILLGNGAGGFSPAAGSPVTVGTAPLSVAIGDVNADGRLDVAVANATSNNVTILLGNGAGKFRPIAGSPVTVGTTSESAGLGDFNADGKFDIAVANSGSDNVTILLNNTTFAADGATCDDGNACTVGETCHLGNCVAPLALGQPAGSPIAVGATPYAVAVGDVNGDGKLDLAVANYFSNNVMILLGNGSGGFSQAAGSPVAVGSPIYVAIGDMNGNGNLDLAVANINGYVTILLGNGSGGFSQAAGSPVAVGANPNSIAVGDVNGDGKSDLVVANASSNNVTILLGNGSGGFGQAAGSPIAVGTGPFSVAVGDWNGDGRLDLAVANNGDGDVTILLGNGSGGFSQAAGSPVPSGTQPASIAIGDVNGDGKPDLAVANFLSNDVTILLGNGSGGFSQAAGSPVAVGAAPASVVVGDVNGDGKLDVAVANYGSTTVTVLLGNGSGGFIQAVGSPFAAGTRPASVVVGDLNGDGMLDLAAANAGSNNVTVLLGKGCPTAGCFALSLTQPSGSPVAVGNLPDSVAVGDVNGDGKLDIAAAIGNASNVAVLLGNGAGGFSQAAGSPVAVGLAPASVVVGDVNGDGKLDLAVANYLSNNVTILLGNGSGGFSQAAGSPVGVGTGPVSVAFGDVDGDGKLDLAVAKYDDNNVTILLGNGSGGFSQAAGSPVAVGMNPHSAEFGDLYGDGKLDLAAANGGSNSVTILLGNGSGGFSQAAGSPIAVGSEPVSVAVKDANGDGNLDLAVANYNGSNVTILLGNGSGGFSQAAGSPVAAGTEPRSVEFGDLNGDGKLDLAVANLASDNVTILIGNGSGGFSQPAGSPVFMGTLSQPSAVAFGDMNADGRLDLAVANYNAGNVAILLNHTAPASNGTACDDGNACTANDVCGGGACAGVVITAPPETQNLSVAANKTTYSWSAAAFATQYDVLRGSTAALPVGPGGGDEVCFDNLAGSTLADGTVPAPNAGFWYLARGENTCGNGTFGTQGFHGVPGVPRVTATCP